MDLQANWTYLWPLVLEALYFGSDKNKAKGYILFGIYAFVYLKVKNVTLKACLSHREIILACTTSQNRGMRSMT